MSVMLSGGEALLAHAANDLKVAWEISAQGWRDKTRLEFETQYIEEFQAAVKSARQSVKAVEELLRQAIRDCE
jgi:hypothetical protein